MRHQACHFSLSKLTRGKTAGAVARAAYIGRCRFHDARTGETYSYCARGGLLEEGVVNWVTGIERLWNEAERAERRKNSCVARELKVSLPSELPLAEMRRLVHGYCCNLMDRYGLAAQWAIHAPKFCDRDDGIEVGRLYQIGKIDDESYHRILMDPERTNLNFHVHILMTTRVKNQETGEFGEKIRCIDRKDTGPEEVRSMRDEWEVRANAALKRVGAKARVDLRSNEKMAAAGEAPEGLEAQPHVGPKANYSAYASHENRKAARREAKQANEGQWSLWLQLRALERERARLQVSQRIATEREAARRADAKAAEDRIATAESPTMRAAAVEAAPHIDALDPFQAAMAWAHGKPGTKITPVGDRTIDPETETAATPESKQPPKVSINAKAMRRARGRRYRERSRGLND